MYYTIYKITNNINGNIYQGFHITEDLNDDYMGSGKLIRAAIKKYGIENFKKEILFIFDSEKEMLAKEKEIVWVGKGSYNLCEGGKGGFGYINKKGLNKNHILTKKDNAKGGDKNLHLKYKIWYNSLSENEKLIHNAKKKHKHSVKTKEKMSQIHRGQIPWNKGIKHKDYVLVI